jgi:DNA-binding NtrC family response regulator
VLAEHPSNLMRDEQAHEPHAMTLHLSNGSTAGAAGQHEDARGEAVVRVDPSSREKSPTSTSEPSLQLAGIPLARLERLAITQTLKSFNGNRTKSAQALGISVRTLQRKLQMWGVANHSNEFSTRTERNKAESLRTTGPSVDSRNCGMAQTTQGGVAC